MSDDTPPPDPSPAPPQPAAPGRSARPPLERSRDRRVVAGVCGGLGRHLDIDPVVFRVVIAVLCLSGGVGLFIYGLAWLVVPVERTRRNELQRLLSGRVDGQSLGAVLVTVLGTGIFFSYMGSSGHIFPLLLIALLAFAALRYDPAKHPRRWEQPVAGAAEEAESGGGVEGSIFGLKFRTGTPAPPSEQPTVPVPPPAPAWWQRSDPMDKHPEDAVPEATVAGAEAPEQGGPDTASVSGRGTVPGPEDTIPTAAAGPPPTPPAGPVFRQAQPRPTPGERRRERSYLSSVFFFLAVITGALVWWVAAKNGHDVNLLAALASGLLVLGLGLIVCSRRGGGRGLVVWATLLTLAVTAVGASPTRMHTAFQRVDWTPAGTAALQRHYDLDLGQGTLNLTGIVPAAGQTVRTSVHLGAGRLVVILPPGTEAKVSAHVGVGSIRLPDGNSDGGISSDRTTDIDPGAAAAHGTISLTLNVGAGDVEVKE